MLVNEKQNTVMTTNTNKEHSFGMKPSAKSFKILSSGIYENKIRAIIRELCCNASDSHISAGKPDIPINVFLPTLFDQVFVVEDFGVGLDHEEVVNVYTTYFESTKTDSPDETGALGLGSKSPFCYQTQMNVVATKNGVERSYSCYIGEDGEPKIRLRSESKKDKPNGVKVVIPVNQTDIHEFENEAEFVFSFFKVRPECNKEVNTVLSQEQIDQIFDKGILQKEITSFMQRVYAVMGNVAYPVSPDFSFCKNPILLNPENSVMFGEEEKYYEFNQDEVKYCEHFYEISSKDFFIHYDLGELDFAASRETLSFDQNTKINFYKKLIEQFSIERNNFQYQLDQCKNKIEALVYFIKQYGNAQARRIGRLFTYDGELIINLLHHNIYNFNVENLNKNIKKFEVRENQTNCNTKVVQDDVVKLSFTNLLNLNSVDIVNHRIKCIYLDNEKLKNGSIKLIRHYLRNFSNNPDLIFFIKETDTFCDEYNIFEFIPISEIKDYVAQNDPDFFSKNKIGKRGSFGVDDQSFLARCFNIDSGFTQSKRIDYINHPVSESAYIDIEQVSGDSFRFRESGSTRICGINSLDMKNLMKLFSIKNLFLKNQRNQKKIIKNGYRNIFDIVKKNYPDIKDEIQIFHDNYNNCIDKEQYFEFLIDNNTNNLDDSAFSVCEKIIENNKELRKIKKEFNKNFNPDKIDFTIRKSTIKVIKKIVGSEKWKQIKASNEIVGIVNKGKTYYKYIITYKYPLIHKINHIEFLSGVELDHALMYIDIVDARQ